MLSSEEEEESGKEPGVGSGGPPPGGGGSGGDPPQPGGGAPPGPPVPPSPAASSLAGVRLEVGPRGKAQVIWRAGHGHGTVCYYPKSEDLDAECRCAGHGFHRLKKTAHAPNSHLLRTKPFQGRTAAGLVAWLEAGPTMSLADHLTFVPDQPLRRRTRTRLKTADGLGVDLLTCERPQRKAPVEPHESDSEPEHWG